jgi:hypothetical protein
MEKMESKERFPLSHNSGCGGGSESVDDALSLG